ncbi:MAG TPA: sigma-70 family RNA polymerase sigma factor [Dehalococcoidia bacterium]|nr:sigma-70 family RNA polymerase sigma factor [Dehalococcoidia bacterium]
MTAERSDEELLRAIAAQDVTALEALYARYGGLAFSLALRVTGNREMAEEVVQEAFLSAWRRGSTYEPGRGSARAWLLGVVHHRAIDLVRARISRGPTVVLDDIGELPGGGDPWPEVRQKLDRETIRGALVSLPDEQRRCIELAYFGGYSYPEIAEQLDVPLGTIKSRLRLGLQRMRSLLADETAPEARAT